MLLGFAVLLLCQLLGELLSAGLGLPLPGPVLGMALLTLALASRKRAIVHLERPAAGLLDLMPLFFIPAGVGIIELGDRLAHDWLPIMVALVGSTLLAFAVTALTMKALLPASRAPFGGVDPGRSEGSPP